MTLPPARWRDWAVVLVAALATSLPYIDKPFHIDDVLYLRVADQILRTPLDPYQGVVLWDAKDGQELKRFRAPVPGRVDWAIMSPDGRFAAAWVQRDGDSSPRRRAAFLWNLETGDCATLGFDWRCRCGVPPWWFPYVLRGRFRSLRLPSGSPRSATLRGGVALRHRTLRWPVAAVATDEGTVRWCG